MNRLKKNMLILAMVLSMAMMSGCEAAGTVTEDSNLVDYTPDSNITAFTDTVRDSAPDEARGEIPESTGSEQQETEAAQPYISYDAEFPPYSGDEYIVVGDGIPDFVNADGTYSLEFDGLMLSETEAFELYSPLDSLGRCGVAFANICPELMPEDAREDISSVEPSGWQKGNLKANGVWVYNRCHLIGFQLAGENDNPLNLITGTDKMNHKEGMLLFENMIADYVHETENHVLYRVTPVFTGDNLVADGVRMEGWSVEDAGDSICFDVFCYNVQDGITIDYATGALYETGTTPVTEGNSSAAQQGEQKSYVLNTKTMKVHTPDCSSIEDMAESNRQDYTGTAEDLQAQGYEACKRCNPF